MRERTDLEFYKELCENFRLTSVLVTYRNPDYHSILQDFFWQTLDIPPKYPRIYKFLDYWEANIDAPIFSVQIENKEIISPANFKSVDRYYKLR